MLIDTLQSLFQEITGRHFFSWHKLNFSQEILGLNSPSHQNYITPLLNILHLQTQ